MKWTKDRSSLLTLICVAVFAALLLVADVLAFRWIGWYLTWRGMDPRRVGRMTATLYAASVFGWICLVSLWRLLSAIRGGAVFIPENVGRLRRISWCCAGAALIFLVSGAYYAPFFIIAVAAAFMMLLVRVIKNVFQQAVSMKDELDLTI